MRMLSEGQVKDLDKKYMEGGQLVFDTEEFKDFEREEMIAHIRQLLHTIRKVHGRNKVLQRKIDKAISAGCYHV